MKFFVDTQLPPKLSKYFLAQNHDSKHTTDLPEGHLLKDSEIIEIAITGANYRVQAIKHR